MPEVIVAEINGVQGRIPTGAKITSDGAIIVRDRATGAVTRFEPLNLPKPRRTPWQSD
jgi:hypothetical protein